ncbi:hypothetical protein [Nonomuraea sp. NEAU-A123]|uniref:hypothetical protein n=1 Tax=Nonomuraea sp. NEAU-A123 TaxID=2839649 RepID=UPI001BE46DE6|nr:hypothetical protein [Nonomuraea sp. NEAU-A123]MBT2232304.1 hypothetical protein [Nonomuraea sp. NEAU-A123]
MEAELMALAVSGASTLITLMISDAWAQTKDRLAAVLGRAGDEEDVLRELEASRAVLVNALSGGDGAGAAVVEGEWRARLLRLLQSDSSWVGELQKLSAAPGGTVYNHITGRVQAGLLIQAGRIERSTFHTPDETT